MNPFDYNSVYEAVTLKDHDAWREFRKKGIGGSDASACLGMSKWMSNVELWKIKTGRKEQDDISANPAVRYGTLAEEPLRQLYKLEKGYKYDLYYKSDTVLINRANEQMRYSPDGLLIEKETGRLGIWECKTATMHGIQKELWKTEIPKEYYIQVLHGMNVTGAEFVELHAQIEWRGERIRRTFHIEREDVLEDLKIVKEGVEEFIGYINRDEEPPLWIN